MITQKVDRDDSVLGIYHEWIREMALKVDVLNVICLYKGSFDLPKNVHVFSLEKERGRKNKFFYILRFYSILFKLRGEYGTVFVHMNPEYLFLAGWLWKILNKKIIFWYNHPKAGILARLGFWLSDVVLATSVKAVAFKISKKTQLMPVGILDYEVDTFIIKDYKKLNILYLGRISPVKNIDILIRAVHLLNNDGYDFALNIVGSPTDRGEDINYDKFIKDEIDKFNLQKKVKFIEAVPHNQINKFYENSNVFVNLTDKGSMDKTIFEAMIFRCLALTSNVDMNPALPFDLADFMRVDINEVSLYSALKRLYNLDKEYINKMIKKEVEYVRENHILGVLVKKLARIF